MVKQGIANNPRTALVSGANRGIGLEIARGLAADGIRVLAGCRHPDAAPELDAAIAAGGDIVKVALDVTVQSSVDALRAEFPDVDILVNNAGVALDKWVPPLDLDIDLWRDTLEVNLFGALRLCQAWMPGMLARGFGRVVNVSSELGCFDGARFSATLGYRSSKTALNMLTRLLGIECESAGDVLINAACPGWVRTEIGGDDAPLTPAQGADTALWLATLPAGGPNGGLFRERASHPW